MNDALVTAALFYMHDALVTAVYMNDDLVTAAWQPSCLYE